MLDDDDQSSCRGLLSNRKLKRKANEKIIENNYDQYKSSDFLAITNMISDGGRTPKKLSRKALICNQKLD